MNEQRINQIVDILKANDTAGIAFAKTNSQLLTKGFMEKEILYSLYEFPYDGKPNIAPPPNPMKAYYEQHPENADKIAKTLLHDLSVDEAGKAAVDVAASGVASELGDRQASAYYAYQASSDIGFPFYAVFFGSLILLAIAVKFKIFEQVYTAFTVLSSLFFVYLLIKKFLAARKPK